MQKYLAIAIVLLISLNAKGEQKKVLVIDDNNELVSLLQKLDYKVDILTVPEKIDRLNMIIEPKNGPQFIGYGSEALFGPFQLYRKIRDKNYDIIFYSERKGNGYYLTEIKKQGEAFKDTILVGYIREPIEFIWDISNDYVNNVSDFIQSEIEQKSIEQSDYVIVPSNYTLNYLKEKGWIFPEKTKIITPLLSSLDENINENNNLNINEIKPVDEIVFIGPANFRNGFDLFFQTIKKARELDPVSMNKVKITVLNDDLDSYDVDELSQLNYNFIKNADYQKYIKDQSRLVVFSSRKELASQKQLIALHEGARFIGMKNGFLEEVTSDEKFLTPAYNTLALAKRLIEEINAPSKEISQPKQTKNNIVEDWKVALAEISQNSDKKYFSDEQEEPFVSVCVTHFNRPKMLKELLEKFGDQTYKNYEVIVMDDGSKPEVVTYLKKEIEPYMLERGWRIFYQDNLFISRARNNLVKEAKGPLILLFEDDDLPVKDTIERFVKIKQRTKADIVNTNLFVAKHNMNKIDEIWLTSGSYFLSIIGENYICLSAISLMTKDIFSELNGYYDEYGFVFSDLEFASRAALNKAKIVTAVEPIYIYNSIGSDHFIYNGIKSYFYQSHISRKYYEKAFPREFRSLPKLVNSFYVEAKTQRFIAEELPFYLFLYMRLEKFSQNIIEYFVGRGEKILEPKIQEVRGAL